MECTTAVNKSSDTGKDIHKVKWLNASGPSGLHKLCKHFPLSFSYTASFHTLTV